VGPRSILVAFFFVAEAPAMTKPWETVVAISDLENRRTLAKILGQLGLDAMCISTVSQCRELLGKGEVKLIFSGEFFFDGDYRAIVADARALSSPGASVILAAPRVPAIADEAVHFGVFDVIGIPYLPTDVEWAVIKARRNRQALAVAQASARLVTPSSQLENLGRRAS
jgi:DNA-binding NtrC family response regulator